MRKCSLEAATCHNAKRDRSEGMAAPEPTYSKFGSDLVLTRRRVIFPFLHGKMKPVKSLLRSTLDKCSMKKWRKHNKIQFCSYITIHEFEVSENEARLDSWFSAAELRRFKREAIDRKHRQGCKLAKAATCFVQDVDISCDKLRRFATRSVLIVESCNMACLLLRKVFKNILPHAYVETAQNSEEAMRFIAAEKNREMNEKYTRADIPTHGFDIIIVGDHLYASSCRNNESYEKKPYPTSGAQLLRLIDSEEKAADDICSVVADGIVKVTHPRYSYLIGVSNNEVCRKELKLSGADEVW
eukprot:CAMPEP_0172481006 /NCGR_PEP_ID=MMETSP1066-20121228/6522_1 /TAXON_ID=671091 /ORGANISM="Coscinodiscus wailesii, Strain CCMP2513" /LENGTH=298 /DNA_ID=CAMNT_0013242869 /DNA_START=14 /DNA_END=907 /DNA_ORIENTATION=-